ncbi:probable membrane-associated kinase regulator 4 [Musa acuminata AAA Group]|uniref:probable membrane-associated kinase regulator 4 n=1 Tax=Musa acuminata AAA Group TaxID=214697 RepID=UPI0031DD082A
MARNPPPNEQLAEEDYIDMDFSSVTFFCASPPHPTEFEFQMSANPQQTEPVASPADELFFQGKLLPLHHPPRLHMGEELVHDPTFFIRERGSDQIEKSTAVIRTRSVATSTPYQSCNASPATSCYVSGELEADDCSEELIQSHPKRSWTRKLKFIKEATLGLKLKASKAYFKSFFTKSRCSNEKFAASKDEHCSHACQKEAERSKEEAKTKEAVIAGHRRSFSGANHWQSSVKSSISSSSCTSSKSSSFSSVNSKESYGQPTLKRSSSVNSDIESSIQGAIAYCKKSHQKDSARRSTSEIGFCLLSVSKIAPHSQHEKPRIWGRVM